MSLCFKTDCGSAQCILFLAPLAFNEFLEEDPKANRLVGHFMIALPFVFSPTLFSGG